MARGDARAPETSAYAMARGDARAPETSAYAMAHGDVRAPENSAYAMARGDARAPKKRISGINGTAKSSERQRSLILLPDQDG